MIVKEKVADQGGKSFEVTLEIEPDTHFHEVYVAANAIAAVNRCQLGEAQRNSSNGKLQLEQVLEFHRVHGVTKLYGDIRAAANDKSRNVADGEPVVIQADEAQLEFLCKALTDYRDATVERASMEMLNTGGNIDAIKRTFEGGVASMMLEQAGAVLDLVPDEQQPQRVIGFR